MVSWLASLAYWRGITRLRVQATLGALLLRGGGGRSRPWLRGLVGALGHFLLGTLAFPTIYALIFQVVGRADVPVGAMIGGGHALLAGLALPLAWRAGHQEGGAGLFGWRLGAATPPALVAAHVLYGLLLGYIYVAPVAP